MSAKYRYVLFDSRYKNNRTELIAVRNVSYRKKLNTYSHASLELNPNQALPSGAIVFGSTDLHIYRNDVRVWGGEVISVSGNIGNVGDTAVLQAVSYEFLLQQMASSGYVFYNFEESGQILLDLIDDRQRDATSGYHTKLYSNRYVEQTFQVGAKTELKFLALKLSKFGTPTDLVISFKNSDGDVLYSFTHEHEKISTSSTWERWTWDTAPVTFIGGDTYTIRVSAVGGDASNYIIIHHYGYVSATAGLNALHDTRYPFGAIDDNGTTYARVFMTLVLGDDAGHVIATSWLRHLGIVEGIIEDTFRRYRLYEHKKIFDAASQLSSIEHGFDYEVDHSKRLNIYYPRKDVYSNTSPMRLESTVANGFSYFPYVGGYDPRVFAGSHYDYNDGAYLYIENEGGDLSAQFNLTNLPSYLEDTFVVPKITLTGVLRTTNLDDSVKFSMYYWAGSYSLIYESEEMFFKETNRWETFSKTFYEHPLTGDPWTADSLKYISCKVTIAGSNVAKTDLTQLFVEATYPDVYEHTSQILRPSSTVSNSLSLSPDTGESAHEDIDEVESDKFGTYLYLENAGGDAAGLFELGNLTTLPTGAVIEKIRITAKYNSSVVTDEVQVELYTSTGTCLFRTAETTIITADTWKTFIDESVTTIGWATWTEAVINDMRLRVYVSGGNPAKTSVTQAYVEVFYAYPNDAKEAELTPFIFDKNLLNIEYVQDFGSPCNYGKTIGSGFGAAASVAYAESIKSQTDHGMREQVSYYKDISDFSILSDRSSELVDVGRNSLNNYVLSTNGQEIPDLLDDVGRTIYLQSTRGIIEIDDYFRIIDMSVTVDNNGGEKASYTITPARLHSPSVFDNMSQLRADVDLALALAS